jgi:hypothetical protein
MPDNQAPSLADPDRLRRALDVLDSIATNDEVAPGVRVQAAKAIVTAAVQAAALPNGGERLPGDVSLADLEAQIAAARKRLGIVADQ